MEKEKKPIVRKNKRRKRLAIVTVILMVLSIIGIMLLTPGFNIKEIKVYGNGALKDEDIIAASGIKLGINIFDFSESKAKENILSMGSVESVKIKRRLPSTVEITIVEEVGVACIKADKGFVIITADGRCIDVTGGDSKTAEVPKLPIVTGLDDVTYKIGEVIKSENSLQLETLFKCLHEFTKQNYVFNMVEIDMSNLNNIKFYYMLRELSVTLGSEEDLGYKMESFGKIFNQLVEDGDGLIPTGNIDLARVGERDQVIYTPPETEESTEEKTE